VAKLRETSKNGNFFKKTVRGGGSKFWASGGCKLQGNKIQYDRYKP
jgi:hypothetical protein